MTSIRIWRNLPRSSALHSALTVGSFVPSRRSRMAITPLSSWRRSSFCCHHILPVPSSGAWSLVRDLFQRNPTIVCSIPTNSLTTEAALFRPPRRCLPIILGKGIFYDLGLRQLRIHLDHIRQDVGWRRRHRGRQYGCERHHRGPRRRRTLRGRLLHRAFSITSSMASDTFSTFVLTLFAFLLPPVSSEVLLRFTSARVEDFFRSSS